MSYQASFSKVHVILSNFNALPFHLCVTNYNAVKNPALAFLYVTQGNISQIALNEVREYDFLVTYTKRKLNAYLTQCSLHLCVKMHLRNTKS